MVIDDYVESKEVVGGFGKNGEFDVNGDLVSAHRLLRLALKVC